MRDKRRRLREQEDLVKTIIRYIIILFNWKIKKNTILNYFPEEISIEVTNNCNFRCKFCPQSDPKHFEMIERKYLSLQETEYLLSRIREGGIKTNVIHWTLDGEPFMNKQFHEICSLAHKYGFTNIYFGTNAFLASVERLLELPKTNGCKYTLHIDFCDNKEYFEKYRGTRGSWEIIKNNILNVLNDTRLTHIHIHVSDVSGYTITDSKELSRSSKNLKKMFVSSRNIQFATKVFHNATGCVKDIDKRKSVRYILCPYPWTSFFIASNGDVVACCRDLQHKTVLGNLFKQELKDIWNGNKYQSFRNLLINKQLESLNACKNCDLPYDKSKTSIKNIISTAFERLQIFN